MAQRSEEGSQVSVIVSAVRQHPSAVSGVSGIASGLLVGLIVGALLMSLHDFTGPGSPVWGQWVSAELQQHTMREYRAQPATGLTREDTARELRLQWARENDPDQAASRIFAQLYEHSQRENGRRE